MDKLIFVGGIIGLSAVLNKKGFTQAEMAISVLSVVLMSVSVSSMMNSEEKKKGSLITIIK